MQQNHPFNLKIATWLLPLLMLVPSCKQVDKLTQFTITYETDVVVPSSSGVNLPFNIFTPEMKTNADSKFEVNDTRKEKIEQIVLERADLTLTSPSDSDFGMLKSIKVFLSADGLDEKMIAFKEDIPDDIGKSLSLNTTGEDVQAYIKKDEFKMRLETVTDEILTRDHKVHVLTDFFVDAKIAGQ